MLLQETKISGQNLDNILHNFTPHYEVMEIESRGTVGGIAILWNTADIQVQGWLSFPRILFGTFRQIGSQENILISTVYGPPIQGEREEFLQQIRTLSSLHQESYWLLGGDFNMILNLDEKKEA